MRGAPPGCLWASSLCVSSVPAGIFAPQGARQFGLTSDCQAERALPPMALAPPTALSCEDSDGPLGRGEPVQSHPTFFVHLQHLASALLGEQERSTSRRYATSPWWFLQSSGRSCWHSTPRMHWRCRAIQRAGTGGSFVGRFRQRKLSPSCSFDPIFTPVVGRRRETERQRFNVTPFVGSE